MDTLSRAQRPARMSRVCSKNTKPRLVVRRLVHSLDFRYRLRGSALPGKPDLVFAGRKRVSFVHGCFWHQHSGRCPLTRLPRSAVLYWRNKSDENRRRVGRIRPKLRPLALKLLVIWECQLQDQASLTARVLQFMESA